jgi:SpoVK/Ycf46/Vps4 family AAA+-type ATPase
MVGTERSVDRMYNQMVDIFLEKLESFNGVLIATTNIVGSMDEAFSRRFHYKLEFPFPDARAREALWVGHLKPTIPLDEDVDFQSLAEDYPFNGGQISLIVRNAAVQAAIRGDRICMSDLRKACEEEQRGTFDSMSMKRKLVGFTSP